MIRRIVLAGVAVAVATLTGAGCAPTVEGVVCEVFHGNYNAGRVPACVGRDWTPSVAERSACATVIQKSFGYNRDAALRACR